MQLTIDQLIEATGATVVAQGAATPLTGLSIDSRTHQSGEWFAALQGLHFDGHRYVDAAIAQGAPGVIVEADAERIARSAAQGLWVLQVPNTITALGAIAHSWRRACSDTAYVGITGSNGKSTTKEMIASIAAARGPLLKTEGNLNNLIGVPLTLFRLPHEARTAVIEMGMSEPGEIAQLTKIVDPDVGVITNISAAHLETLLTIDNVAKAKGELFAEMRPDATLVINDEDPWVRQVAANHDRPKLTFGMGNDCDIRFGRMRSDDLHGTELTLYVRGEECHTRIPVPGTHNVMNALAATAVGVALDIPVPDIMQRLPAFEPMRMRMERVQLANGVQVINDSYNANPDSMQAALRTVSAAARAGRFVVIFGDMLELGPEAGARHRELGERAVAAGVEQLFVCGNHADDVAAGAQDAGLGNGRLHAARDDRAGLQQTLLETVQPGDVVLVKGSRGMQMEQFVEFLKQHIGVN